MDASTDFARLIVNTAFDNIPPDAVEGAKRDILDTLGVAVAGSGAAGISEIMELVREWGGKKQSSIIMHDQKVPAPLAALVNGTMAHALDYDEVHESSILHAGVTLIPAAFAIAESLGKVSGKIFITAIVLGIEVTCRLGVASNKNPTDAGWIYTPLYGIFGSAAAAGKLLNLDEKQVINAFGIAYSQTSGNFQAVIDGALTKRIQAGFASRGGLVSALMAQKGLTGAHGSFEGQKGLYKIYHGGDYDPKALTDGLGRRFLISDLSFKPYPSCRGTHSAIDATLALVEEHDIVPDDVAEILVRTGEVDRMLCEPLEVKQRPRGSVDGQFSIPWTIATALVKGRVSIDEMNADAIKDPSIILTASKVKPLIVKELGDERGTPPIEIEIRMKDNRVFSRKQEIPKGNPGNSMTWQDLCDKFNNCIKHGIRSVSEENREKVLKMLTDLEEVEDVCEIIRILG